MRANVLGLLPETTHEIAAPRAMEESLIKRLLIAAVRVYNISGAQ